MMRVVSVAEMRELERRTFAGGVSEDELQRRAGRAVAAAIRQEAPDGAAVVALVGPGNNGRDAWIAASELLRAGWRAALYLTPRHAISQQELSVFRGDGGAVLDHAERGPEALEKELAAAQVAIDGLLGIGARGDPRPPLDEIILLLNRARSTRKGLQVVVVDVPSGVDADSGAVSSCAVCADLTVVLGHAKRGLLSTAAALATGRLVFADIGVVDPGAGAGVITADLVRGSLSPSAPDAHKGTFGRVLVVAGSARFPGAASLTCGAAARAGVGIVALAAPPWLRDVVAARVPEAISVPLPVGGPAGDASGSLAAVEGELARYDALVLGPGLSLDGEVVGFVEGLLRARAGLQLPAVVDADGLNALARLPDWPSWIGRGVVITPHAGELERLAGETTLDEPWELASQLSERWGITVLIKGPFTAIGSDGEAWVHARPNPGLATAGTGDVLSGILGALLARGVSPARAACVAAWVHGEAGWRATRGRPAGGTVASDLLTEIPPALAACLPG